jgi:hypothetical protein
MPDPRTRYTPGGNLGRASKPTDAWKYPDLFLVLKRRFGTPPEPGNALGCRPLPWRQPSSSLAATTPSQPRPVSIAVVITNLQTRRRPSAARARPQESQP